jgi:hypothetical protein
MPHRAISEAFAFFIPIAKWRYTVLQFRLDFQEYLSQLPGRLE